MKNPQNQSETTGKAASTASKTSTKPIFILILVMLIIAVGFYCFFQFLLPTINSKEYSQSPGISAESDNSPKLDIPAVSKPAMPKSIKRINKNETSSGIDKKLNSYGNKNDSKFKDEPDNDIAEGSAKLNLNQLVKEIVYQINNGKFRAAYEYIKKAKKIQNLAQAEIDNLMHLESLARISNEYAKIDSIRYDIFKGNMLPVQIMLENLSAYNGTISKKEYKKIAAFVGSGKTKPKGAVVIKIKYRKNVRYVSINYRNIAKIIALNSEEDLDYYWAEEIETKRDAFLNKPRIIAVDKLIFAFFLKKVAPNNQDVAENELLKESQELFTEALKDDKYIWQSYKLSRNKNYYEYIMLIRQNKRSDAKKILIELFNDFPYASQLYGFRENSDDVSQQMIDNIEKEGLNGAKTESEKSKAEKIEDENLDRILQSSLSIILEQAEKMYAKGLEFDKDSLPGSENSEENIEKAKYYYLLARQLYKKASKKGKNVDDKLVEINRALYWLRKRSGF